MVTDSLSRRMLDGADAPSRTLKDEMAAYNVSAETVYGALQRMADGALFGGDVLDAFSQRLFNGSQLMLAQRGAGADSTRVGALWLSGNYRDSSGDASGASWDSELFSAQLGADIHGERWMAGMAGCSGRIRGCVLVTGR